MLVDGFMLFRSWLGLGNYDVNVLMLALESVGYEVRFIGYFGSVLQSNIFISEI